LAHTIEPRAPIGKLGFTESYPLLEIGENVQERVSMHAAQCRTTPISGALKLAKERPARAEKLAVMPERTARRQQLMTLTPTNPRCKPRQ